MQITFLGATRTVTGSKYLLEDKQHKILVDCGLFQGYKELRLRNWAKLPIDPKSIDEVLLTHAHIDHSGYLPLLVKNGFNGHIYATKGTKALCDILLPDSGYLQEEEARTANKYGYSKHHPALPLYTRADAFHSLEYFQTVDFMQPVHIGEFSARFHRGGHILGASIISVNHQGDTIVFTGDLGRPHDPIMRAPVHLQNVDYLVVESTYGDRLHPKTDPMDELSEIINRTCARGGTIIVPAFAVGRAQMVLYFVAKLRQQKLIPNIPIFLDSPMAIDATEIFYRFSKEHRLSKEECRLMNQSVKYTNTVEESKELDQFAMPSIIVSASGMVTGGRVLHHIKALAGDHRNTILFTGYQAGDTRGDRIVRGEKEVKMLGQMVHIDAEVVSLSGLSAHSDYQETLDWMKSFSRPPRKIFITHGEAGSADTFKNKIEDELGWDCIVPEYQDSFQLSTL